MPKHTKTKPDGISRMRINKKTGKTQYCASYRYLGVDGKTHQSDTAWCDTPEEARKAAEEKKRFHEEETRLHESKKSSRKNQTVKQAYDLFVKDLKEDADPDNYREQTTGKSSLHRDAATLGRYYLPNAIGSIRLKSLGTSDFANWLTRINTMKQAVRNPGAPLSGTTIRKYHGILVKFNNWLDLQGYYKNSDMASMIEVKMSRVKLKPKSAGAREDRNAPTLENFLTILDYYREKGLWIYENFYWFCFYSVLFYTGMRVSEIVGLRWKDIDFGPYHAGGTIYIRSSVEAHEKRETVNKRMEKDILFTKNKQSKRQITPWAAYKDYLRAFYEDSYYHFNYTPEEMKNAFVFPNITARDPANRTGYQHHNNLLRNLDRITEELGIPKLDNQMFRHGCAYFLILDLHLAEDDIIHYFGHEDSKMLKEIYAKLSVRQNQIKTDQKLASLIKEGSIIDHSGSADHVHRLEDLQASDELYTRISNEETNRVYHLLLEADKLHKKTYPMSQERMLKAIEIKMNHPEIKVIPVYDKNLSNLTIYPEPSIPTWQSKEQAEAFKTTLKNDLTDPNSQAASVLAEVYKSFGYDIDEDDIADLNDSVAIYKKHDSN